VLGLVYVPIPPEEYAVCKEDELVASINELVVPVVATVKVVSALSNLTLVRLVQSLKAEFPMLVTLFGMVMLVRLVQP